MHLHPGEFVYSIYTTDDGVVIFDTLPEARRGITRRESLVDVAGPFIHPRHELPLLQVATIAARELRQLCADGKSSISVDIERIANKLEASVRSAYPFRRLPLPTGKSINLKSDTPDNSSE